MKRFLAILLAVTLLIAVVPASAFADDTKTVYISRNGSGTLNLREGPGYDYDITGHYVYHNSKVTVKKTSGKWSKVKVKSSGHVGWIRTYYIDGTTKKLGTGTHVIKYDDTKVRKKASSSASVVTTLDKGDTVRVYETSHDYARVTITGSGKTGWVKMSAIGGQTSDKPDKPSGGTVYRVKTNGGNLNVRTGPGTGYGIITSIHNGTAFTVKSKSGSWYKIKTLKTGITGWVSKNLTSKNATGRVSTNGGRLNVRRRPTTSASILGSLNNGTHVTATNVSGNWAYVVYGSLKGWSSLNYLRF